MSDKNLEQRINVKFCVKIGKSASETLALITVAYNESAIKKSSAFEWHRRFKAGREDMQDNAVDQYVQYVRRSYIMQGFING
jgi:hypothetical protein